MPRWARSAGVGEHVLLARLATERQHGRVLQQEQGVAALASGSLPASRFWRSQASR